MAQAPHDFVVVIPVADRPRHLQACLSSLQALLQTFPYAGAVSVLIVDDSLDAGNSRQFVELAKSFSRSGLACQVLDPARQRASVLGLPVDLRDRLKGVLGHPDREGKALSWGHKGASITRNIALLWLAAETGQGADTLYWFVDSDQEFRVCVEGADGESLQTLDYFNALDALFHAAPLQVLTGKVVGDPPVSPAVMAGTFLDDLRAFLADLASQRLAAPCTFHGVVTHSGDAAYHDMADLFGFRAPRDAWRYRCDLAGPHDHAACLRQFADKLGHFFDGEHPTRKSFYVPADGPGLQPARTLYTGNFVMRADALEGLIPFFIPFAELKLRMAGPTLGRIMQAELGQTFVSANLPMLHRRTVDGLGQSECRPGVDRTVAQIDLSGEYERQFYGDVMLFSVARLAPGLAERGVEEISAVVGQVEAEMRARYRTQQTEVVERLAALRGQVEALSPAWPAPDREAFTMFMANIQANFGPGSKAQALLDAAAGRQQRLAAISAAIAGYAADRAAWREALGWQRRARRQS